MSMPFLPPPGAMQFEFTHPLSWMMGEVIWVRQYFGRWKKDSLPCDCKEGFLVYRESESQRIRERVRDRKPKVVCKCMGRVIE